MPLQKSIRFFVIGVISLGTGWISYQSLAGRRTEEQGDTKPAPRRPWDSARDMPPPVASDKAVKIDYPIAYVRVPRPYPKAYSGINHLNQAGLHQTNAPGAELRLYMTTRSRP